MTGSVVFLPCGDIERTRAFYQDLLGLPVAQKQGSNLYIFDTGYGHWGFCRYADGRRPLSGPQGVCLSLNLPDEADVRAMYERVRGRCEIYRAPARHPDFPVYSFFALDPDGYLVEFQKIDEPEAEGTGRPE